MGEYNIPGFLSGKNYKFTISGDEPSPTEMQRMQGILQRDELAYKQEFEQQTGLRKDYDPEAGTAIGRGLKRGIPQFQSALGTAAEYAGLEGVGDYLDDAARERQRNILATDPSLMESPDFRKVRGLSSGLTYVGELFGEQLPLIGATLAGTGATALTGVGLPVAAAVGTIAASYPQLFGSNIQRQEAQVTAGELPEVDTSRAALTAIGQTALEAASNLLLVGQAGKGVARALLTNIPAEAATEVGQQVLERKQAGLDLDSEDAYREYLDAGVAGGTLGGLFGGVGALGSSRKPDEVSPAAPVATPDTGEQFDDGPIGQRPETEFVSPEDTDIGAQVDLSTSPEAEPDFDFTAPVTESTLKDLGLPENVPIYRAVNSGQFDNDTILDRLVDYGRAAATSSDPAVRTSSPRVLNYVNEVRRLKAEPVMKPDDVASLQDVSPELPTVEPQLDLALPEETAAVTEPSPPEAQPTPEVSKPRATKTPPRGRTPTETYPFLNNLKGRFREGSPAAKAIRDMFKAEGKKVLPNMFAPENDQGAATDFSDLAAEDFLSDYVNTGRLKLDDTGNYVDAASVEDLIQNEIGGESQFIGTDQELVEGSQAQRESDLQDQQIYDALSENFKKDNVKTTPTADDISAVRRLVSNIEDLNQEAIESAAYEVSSARTREADVNLLGVEPETALQVEGQPFDIFEEDVSAYPVDEELATEATPAGEQTLVPGVEPVSTRDQLQAKQDAPLRGGAKPATEGLFDVEGRAQDDMFGPSERPFSPASINDKLLTTRVMDLLDQGDLLGALQEFSATTGDKYLKALANKMSPYIGDTGVKVLPDNVMRAIRENLDTEGKSFGDWGSRGVYIPMPNAAQLSRLRNEGKDAAAATYQRYGGQVLINRSRGLDSTTLLHEVTHATSDKVLTNENHPLFKQMENLRLDLLKFMPESTYGLLNVRELMAEGMTNRQFRIDLSNVNVNNEPFSAWQKFKNNLKNFLRNLIGLKSKPLGSPADIIDGVLENIIASSPSQVGSGEVLSASFRPDGAKEVLNGFASKVKVPNKEDLAKFKEIMRDLGVSPRAKRALIWAAMPLDYIADAAKKYMPSARKMHDLIGQHKAERDKFARMVSNTADVIDVHHKNNPDQVSLFEKIRFWATTLEMDPRKSISEYEGFSYRYKILDSFGNVSDTVTSKRYKTLAERNRAMRAHNTADIPNTTKAKQAFNEDPEKLEIFKELQRDYNSLNKEGKDAIERVFNLPNRLWQELQSVLKERLELMFEGNPEIQQRVFKKIYDKIFAENLIDPFQSLSRDSGDYGLSYRGMHPETGNVVPLIHFFQTSELRVDAMRRLEALGPEAEISDMIPFMNGERGSREKVPMKFISDILDVVEKSGDLTKDAQEKIAEIVLNSAPETSFLNSFRKRKGTEGYIGGLSPLSTERLSAGDSVANIRSNAIKLANSIVNIRYGARFSKLTSDLKAELAEYQSRSENGPIQRAKDQAESQIYFDALTSYADSAFQNRGSVTQALTGGAYAMTLGVNVSTAVLTFASIPMFLAPYLAGKYGMRSTVQALGIGGRILAGTGRTRTEQRVGLDGNIEEFQKEGNPFDYSLDNTDLTDPSNPRAYLAPLQDLGRRLGIFNRSLRQDITDGQGTSARSKMGSIAQKIVAKSGIFQHYAERYNRETALISAYLLALKKTAKDSNMGDFSVKQLTKKLEAGEITFSESQMSDAAVEAANIAEKTNGSMYAASGSQAAQSDIGSIIFLFKRHPLSMYNLIFQTMMRSVKTKAEIALLPEAQQADAFEDRRVAQLQLGGMMGATALTAGALGLPLVQQIGWIYDMFADDDEEDFETVTRIALGEWGAFGIIDYITGARASERISLSGGFYRPGFSSDNLPVLFQAIEGFGGPVVGLMLKQDRTYKLFADGELWRGTESLLPSALANVMRGARYADEGVRTRRHDPVIDDIGPFSVAGQFFGFMPAEYARQLDVNAAGLRIDNAINKKRTQLLSKLNRSDIVGDRQTSREIRDEIAAFNRRNPNNQITSDTIERSRKTFEKRTEKTNHGVVYTDRNLSRIMETVNAFGPATFY